MWLAILAAFLPTLALAASRDAIAFDPALRARNERTARVFDIANECTQGIARLDIVVNHVRSRAAVVAHAEAFCGKTISPMLPMANSEMDTPEKAKRLIDVMTYNAITAVEREGE